MSDVVLPGGHMVAAALNRPVELYPDACFSDMIGVQQHRNGERATRVQGASDRR